jgi:NADH:ubiquinone oxidoreductase subunit 5 (subunit L)/multisubunit Na+/H+ antiporter MnhA subunit
MFLPSSKKKEILKFKIKYMIAFKSIFKFFYNAYYFNEIYNSYIYKYRNLGYVLFKNLDKGFIEGIGPLFIVNFVQKLKLLLSKRYKGLIDHYVFIMIFGLLNIIIFIYFLDI